MNTTPTEYVEQVTLADYLAMKKYLFTAIPCGQRTSIGHAMKMKRMGVNRGCPDVLVVLPDRGLLFIEMKRLKGSKVYPEQELWWKELNKIPGVESIICHGAEAAIKYLEELEKAL